MKPVLFLAPVLLTLAACSGGGSDSGTTSPAVSATPVSTTTTATTPSTPTTTPTGASPSNGASGSGSTSTPSTTTTPSTAALTLNSSASPVYLGSADADFIANLSYGSANRQQLDLFLPDSGAATGLVIYMHGGAFIAGDKSSAYSGTRANEIRQFLERGIAYATINYRFIQNNDPTGVIKPLRDAARALQFLRLHAEQLNIDKQNVVMYGRSAGAGTALWLAFHNDLAIANHSDPILRESTRLRAAAGLEGQASYDLLQWENRVFDSYGLDITDKATELGLYDRMLSFLGISDVSEMYTSSGASYRANVDMINLMSTDDPEFYFRNELEDPGYPDSETELVHHALHAEALQERADFIGVPSTIYAPQIGLIDSTGENLMQFLIRKSEE